jgi:gluconolactonase
MERMLASPSTLPAWLLAPMLGLVACSGANPTSTADARAPGDAATDTAILAPAPEDAATAFDAAPNAGDADTEPLADAAPHQQEAGDSAAKDAAASSATLAARICGDAGGWPSPLPADVAKRTAQPVGSQQFGFLEGPVWIEQQGVLLFSDMDFAGGDAQGPPAKIRRLTPPSTYDVFSESSNSNGLALAPDGRVLAATHDNQGLSLFQLASAARTPLAVRADGKHLNSPNDLTVRSDGTVYVTDPDWQLGPRSSETAITGAYRIAPWQDANAQLAAVLFEGTLQKPNGIALSPDEHTLYLGSSGNEIWEYRVAADGTLSGRAKFADTGDSDGMAIDCAGNLYVASGTIEVFAPDGSKLGEINVAETPSNAAFGGAQHRTLYITAGTRLYALELNVPGMPF